MFYHVEERLRNDAENGKLSIPLPNPASETASLKMMDSGTYRKRQMPIRYTIDIFILSSKLNRKVVWIALSEDDQRNFLKLCFTRRGNCQALVKRTAIEKICRPPIRYYCTTSTVLFFLSQAAGRVASYQSTYKYRFY